MPNFFQQNFRICWFWAEQKGLLVISDHLASVSKSRFLLGLPATEWKTPKWAAREPSTWEHSQRFLPSYFSVFSGRNSPQSNAELQMKAAVHRAGIPKTKAKRERSGGQMRRRRRTRGLLAARTCTEVRGRNRLEGRWPRGSHGQSDATRPTPGSQAAITFLHRLTNFKHSKREIFLHISLWTSGGHFFGSYYIFIHATESYQRWKSIEVNAWISYFYFIT